MNNILTINMRSAEIPGELFNLIARYGIFSISNGLSRPVGTKSIDVKNNSKS